MDWITDPRAWIGLLTLTLLEIVLGIDNIVFISIVAGKLPPSQQRPAWRWGLILALIPRMILLLFLGVLLRMTHPLFTLFGSAVEENPWAISGKDLILIVGGLGTGFHLLVDALARAREVLVGGGFDRLLHLPQLVQLTDALLTSYDLYRYLPAGWTVAPIVAARRSSIRGASW